MAKTTSPRLSPSMLAFLRALSRWSLGVTYDKIDGHLWATQTACERRGLVQRVPNRYRAGEYRWSLTDAGASCLPAATIERAAQQIGDALRTTADRYHRGEITHAQLGEDNAACWARAVGPIRDAVHANLRAQPTNDAPADWQFDQRTVSPFVIPDAPAPKPADEPSASAKLRAARFAALATPAAPATDPTPSPEAPAMIPETTPAPVVAAPPAPVATEEHPEPAPEPVKVSIESGPVTPDADGQSRGWSAALVVDPESRSAYLFTTVGAGTPGNVWHGRARAYTVNVAASGEHLRDLLEGEEGQGLLAEICDAYQGAEWDGSNLRGQWAAGTEDDGMADDAAGLALEALLAELPTYWAAGDWIGGDRPGVAREVRELILAAESDEAEAKALRQYAEQMAEEGKSNGALLDADDLESEIKALAEEARADEEDTEEDRPFWVVERGIEGEPSIVLLRDQDRGPLLGGLPTLGKAWAIVEASSPVRAWVAARALLAQGPEATIKHLRALERRWCDDTIEALVAALDEAA